MERKKKPIPLTALMEFDSLSESSEDSDFRIEDHIDESNEEVSTIEDDSSNSEELETEDLKNVCEKNVNTTDAQKIVPVPGTQVEKQLCKKLEVSGIIICCVCLGDKSDDNNEIIECDNCGVTVHEDCYGISDSDSVSTSDSGSSKMPWFCEACQAGKANPSCELCPNSGGVFKETDSGMWVHLVCALYIPGVAFRDVDKLCNVTLFEMSYSKWSERACSLCPDQQFSRTGVCIGCDAGLCKAYFHVTCAQREGLLAEAQSEEINHADPFYAHCKLHSDKYSSKILKRNWLALELRMADRKKLNSQEKRNNLSDSVWMKEKLLRYQYKYNTAKTNRAKPWIPTQKMARPLTSSARTLRALSKKATLSGIDSKALALKEDHTKALADVHRKWHISPAFNVEYMGYYLDRNSRICSLKLNLDKHVVENLKLMKEQKELQVLYSQAIEDYNVELALNKNITAKLDIFQKILPNIDLTKKLTNLNKCNSSASKNASESNEDELNQLHLKIDRTTHFGNNEIPESLNIKCVTCGLATDHHLLVKCDTCQLHYHLGCLDPPLKRMPKKTRVMGWQCSECDKSSSDSEVEFLDIETPRQLRQIKGNWKVFKPWLESGTGTNFTGEKENVAVNNLTLEGATNFDSALEQTCSKQLKRKTNQKASTNAVNSKPRKIKQKCFNLKPTKPDFDDVAVQKPTIKLENILATNKSTGTFKLSSVDTYSPQTSTLKKSEVLDFELRCDTCQEFGTKLNIVTCDECQKGFHFCCLNPPVKKSPKVRGYSWHCADCDPSESDSD